MLNASSDSSPVALLTGTNRGTGRAIAKYLYGRGYRLVSVNRTLVGEDWVGEHYCDLANLNQVENVARRIGEQYPQISACVTVSVERGLCRIGELDRGAWERGMSVNLHSSAVLISTLLPSLRAAGGDVVIVGSHAGSQYFESGAVYSSSKAALKAFVETLLIEERPNGVRSTLLSPGAIANLDEDECQYKMTTESVARCVGILLENIPRDAVVGEMEIRPAQIPVAEVSGLDRIRYV